MRVKSLRGLSDIELLKTIAIASDHNGFLMKEHLLQFLKEKGYAVSDQGCFSEDSVDYPQYAMLVSEQLQKETADYGILICGTGIGMCIAANKFQGIRAALCSDVFTARMTKEHNFSNVLCLGAHSVSQSVAAEVVLTWLETEDFLPESRHVRRVQMITDIEEGQKQLVTKVVDAFGL